MVVNYMREYQLGLGIPREQVYNQTMYILVGMLVVGLVANALVRPLNPKHFMTPEELARERQIAHDRATASAVVASQSGYHASSMAMVYLAWAAVGIPLVWGVYRTLLSVGKFFH